MLLFMDESGDKGPVVAKGSSKLLAVTAVVFRSEDSARKCREAIASFREKIGGGEFHFRENDNDRRIAFLEAVSVHELSYYAVVCRKERLDYRRWKNPSDLFHEIAGRVIDSVKESLKKSRLFFDTLGGKTSDCALASYLKKRAGIVEGVPRICRAKSIRKSGNDNLIQLADMICGAIVYSFGTKSDCERFRRIIIRCEKLVLEWPEKE